MREFQKKKQWNIYQKRALPFLNDVAKAENRINNNDLKFTSRCSKQDTRIPATHVLGKLHKGKFDPPPYRSVIAIPGSSLHGVGRWVDSYLKELLPFCKTYIKNSDDVLKSLKRFLSAEENVSFTTCDAVAMYPNIKTEEGLAFIIATLDGLIFRVKPENPRKQLLVAMCLLLKRIVFQFDDTYFR